MTMLRYAFRADFKFGAMLLVHSAAAVLAWCSSSNAMGFLFCPPNCEQRQVLSQAISPDGAWVATLYNNICSDGAFVTTIGDTVEITRPNEPATPMPAAGSTVFGMADPPYGVPKPLAVRWTAQRSLEITIPNGLSPGQAIAKGWRFASSGAHTNPMSLIGPTRKCRLAAWRVRSLR